MQFSTMINTLDEARGRSEQLERLGYDALFTNESKHDPFVLAALMAEHTSKVELMTYIAVAFARTPMTVAHAAHDVNSLAGGRFTLGIGSQIKSHVTRRFSMPWSHPAPRMKEFIQALYAIWDCWYQGKPLQFEGEFYTHTLTSPMFLPEDRQYGRPKVMLAAVGPAMTRVAAEVADGLLCHSFTTERYLREVTLPAVEHVLQTNGRRRGNFRIVGMPFIAMGQDDEELENSIAAARRSVAFYASTPAYKPVLDFHGWGDIQPEMLRLSKLGRWQEMGEILDDEILRAFCVIGDPAQCAQQLKKRFSGVFDLACGYSYSRVGPGGLPAEILHELRKPE
jgi:probable F420-dependent oxidoreductase